MNTEKMRIGLIDVDSKYPNLALMKLSAYHKQKGDYIEFYNPFWEYDIVYASKVFDFTPDYPHPVRAHKFYKGGSGYDLITTLPVEIEHIYPDYELYGVDYAMGFTTRGCIRQCPFCIVPKKEGYIRAVADIYEFWNGQEKIRLLDNNLTAHHEHFIKILNQLIKEKVKVDFNQGLDIRLIDDEKAKLLAQVRLWKQIHFAWDLMGIEKAVRRGIEILKRNGVHLRKLMFYVLIGFNTTPEEDLYRVETLRGLGVDPFVMPYNKFDPYQRNFARWVNHKAIFKSVSWQEYKKSYMEVRQ